MCKGFFDGCVFNIYMTQTRMETDKCRKLAAGISQDVGVCADVRIRSLAAQPEHARLGKPRIVVAQKALVQLCRIQETCPVASRLTKGQRNMMPCGRERSILERFLGKS